MEKMEVKKPRKILFKITDYNLNLYDKRSVFFTQPYLLACYERNYLNVTLANKIRYLKTPKLSQYPFDLNDGFETFQPRLSKVFHNTIDITLKYLMSPKSEEDSGDDNDKVDSVERTKVYTRRGTLSTIMKSCYAKKYNNWTIRVTRSNGNIYMYQVKDQHFQSHNELKKQETHHSRLSKLLFAESPYELPKANEPCDENITLNSVQRSSFGKYDIVYSGEMQGIVADEEFKDFNNLEALNKCRFVLSKQVWDTLKNDDETFLKYWLHAYLANVEEMYVAYKNPKGIVEEPIEQKIVSNFPKNRFWKPKICTALLHDFLDRVENLMSNVNCYYTVYDFHFSSNHKVISYEIYEGKTEKTFLTEEYIDFCKDKNLN